jgi:predicted transcriptional regulator
MSREPRRRPRGSLEQEVVAVLAAAGEPMTPGQVQAAIGANLAYTTVMTVLTRLAEKGEVVRQRAGRAFAYTAIADEAEVTARRMRRLLDSRDDRAAVLSRFVGALSEADERTLADLLDRAERPDRP